MTVKGARRSAMGLFGPSERSLERRLLMSHWANTLKSNPERLKRYQHWVSNAPGDTSNPIYWEGIYEEGQRELDLQLKLIREVLAMLES